MTIDISCERVAFRGINPRCPALRREKLETIKVVGFCKKLTSTCVFTSATSHLHISTSCFQKTISACTYKPSALHQHMAYIRLVAVLKKILSTCVFESAPRRLSVRFMLASTPVYITFILFFLSSEMQSIAQASRTTRQQCSSELSHFRGIQVDPNHSDSKPRATMRSKW